MSARNDRTTAREPFGRTRVVEGGGLAVQLHVAWEDTWAVDPRVVEVVLSSLNEHDLEAVVQIGQTASNDATASCQSSQCLQCHPNEPA